MLHRRDFALACGIFGVIVGEVMRTLLLALTATKCARNMQWQMPLEKTIIDATEFEGLKVVKWAQAATHYLPEVGTSVARILV